MSAYEVFLNDDLESIFVKAGIPVSFGVKSSVHGYEPTYVRVTIGKENIEVDPDICFKNLSTALALRNKIIALKKEYEVWQHKSIIDVFNKYDVSMMPTSGERVGLNRIYAVEPTMIKGKRIIVKKDLSNKSLLIKMKIKPKARLNIKVFPAQGRKSYKYDVIGSHNAIGQVNLFSLDDNATASIRIFNTGDQSRCKAILIHHKDGKLYTVVRMYEDINGTESYEFTPEDFESAIEHDLRELTKDQKEKTNQFVSAINKLIDGKSYTLRTQEYDNPEYEGGCKLVV